MGMTTCRPLSTPMVPSISLFKDSSPSLTPAEALKFRKCYGSFQYVTLTRPDLMFAFNKLTQFIHSPT